MVANKEILDLLPSSKLPSKPELLNENGSLDYGELKALIRSFGADDVGFVPVDRQSMVEQKEEVLKVFPKAKSFISFVVRMNREPIKSTARSMANLEFHSRGDQVNHVSQNIVAHFEKLGIAAVNPSMGFPMEMQSFPGKIWVVSHKPIAEAAGLGKKGINRNVIHPKFGNFILLGTVAVDAEISEYDYPIEYNPCVDCKLCVSACPVGAISKEGHFDFSACYTHNYREFMGGFTNFVEMIADSKNKESFRDKVTASESASMWQSLSFGPNYKAAYCMSVCPAGEDVIGNFLESRKDFVQDVVRPLQKKEEPLYVLPNSDAQEYARKRFPHKEIREVDNSLRPDSIEKFIAGLRAVFQRRRAQGVYVKIDFYFTGQSSSKIRVEISNSNLSVSNEFSGKPALKVTSDSKFWVDFLNHRRSIFFGFITGKLKVSGNPKQLLDFKKCFAE